MEIREAFTTIFEELKYLPISAIQNLRNAYGNMQIAIISIPTSASERILSVRKMQIRWAVYPMSETKSPQRCFRCLEYGHIASRSASSSDRSNTCLRCVGSGNFARACKNSYKYTLCLQRRNANTDHITGSKRCPVVIE